MDNVSPCLDPTVGPDRQSVGAPRWVKVLGLIALVLVVMVVILAVTGGGGDGGHAPGRHAG